MLGINFSNKYVRLTSLVLAACIAIYLTIRITNFVHIFQTHAGILLTQRQVLDAYESGTYAANDAVVPKIIHQIFHNWTHPGDDSEDIMAADWKGARQSCIDNNPGWEHWLWNEKASHEFIENNYPWFLNTYDGFQFPVQRNDALRYFLMRHFGGIYIDLDNGCQRSLEPLRYYPVWITDGGRGTLSNNILGAEPNHPFWTMFTDSIQTYAWKYPLPYITISYATGQWFETVMWEQYHQKLPADGEGLVRVLMDGREGKPEWLFFNHNRGGTWDNWDNQMFAWIGVHILQIAIVGAAIPLLGIGLCVWFRRRRGYSRVQASNED